jgi:hypothetical protein
VDNKISIIFFDRKTNRVIWTSASEADFIEPKWIAQITGPTIKKMLVKSPLKKRQHSLFYHRS